MQQADRVVRLIVGAERIGADEFRQRRRLVCGGAAQRAHFVQHGRYAMGGELPGGLTAGQSPADNMHGLQRFRTHGTKIGLSPGGDNARGSHCRATGASTAMRTPVLFAAVVLTLCALPQAHAYDSSIVQAYSTYSLSVPTAASVIICHGFGCDRRTEIGLGKADHSKLATLLAPGKKSAEAERGALATAIAWFDRRVGPEA